jgi:uncharacterized membrane protein YeaQ/YmgE (transglycosylase-associated protein family)
VNILIYLIVAAIIGWAATELMHDSSNLLLNIVIAVLGAFLAGYFLSPIFKVGTINDTITVGTMLVTLLGRSSCWQSSTSSAGARATTSRV